MTEDEIVKTLTRIDTVGTNLCTISVGPFSVFSLQSHPCPDSATSYACAEAIELKEVSPTQATYDDSDDPRFRHQSGISDSLSQCHTTTTNDAFAFLNMPHGRNNNSSSYPSELSQHPIGGGIDSFEQDSSGALIQAVGPESLKEAPIHSNSLDEGGMRFIESPILLAAHPPIAGPISSELDAGPIQSTSLSNRVDLCLNASSVSIQSLVWSSKVLDLDYSLSTTMIREKIAAILMNHYTNKMVHLMQPVLHQGNPFKNIYLPLAIKGSSSSTVANDSDHTYSASVAVFHSLLSAAAINLQGPELREDGLQQLAFHHKQHALVALRNALATRSSNYKDLMTAILSLVSIDVSVLDLFARSLLIYRSSMAVFMIIGFT